MFLKLYFMSFKSKIQWTESTVNFWMGCKKVSPGCKFCYMYRIIDGKGGNPEKIWKTQFSTFHKAQYWKKGRRIFTNSMSDFFIEDADNWRNEAWDVIKKTPQHEWQILTKRVGNIQNRLPNDWGNGWDNVILGTSVESQAYFYRVHELSKIPAKRRFLSLEPLLEPLDLMEKIDGRRPIDDIDWVIIGGESGNKYGKYIFRPCEIQWIEKIIADLQDEAPHIKIFVKQLGTYQALKLSLKDMHGGDLDEWPDTLEHLKLREFAPELK